MGIKVEERGDVGSRATGELVTAVLWCLALLAF